jgi:hypothetical protein
MTALFIAPRVPLVDPKTGICNPIWYRFFTDFFTTNGVGTVIDANAFEVFPLSQVDAFSALLPKEGGDLSPAAFVPPDVDDDVNPTVTHLLDLISALQTQVDDIKKGLMVL